MSSMAHEITIESADDLLRQIEAVAPTLQAVQRVTLVAEQELVCTQEIRAEFHNDARVALASVNRCLSEAIAQLREACAARRNEPR